MSDQLEAKRQDESVEEFSRRKSVWERKRREGQRAAQDQGYVESPIARFLRCFEDGS